MLHIVTTREQIIKNVKNIDKSTNRINCIDNQIEHENIDLTTIVKLFQLIMIKEEAE